VIGYAESVSRSISDIFRDCDVQFDPTIADEVVFLSGIRKLYSIISSSYWTLDNSGALLERLGTGLILAGAADLSRGGDLYKDVGKLLRALDEALLATDSYKYMKLSPRELVVELATDERS